MIDPGRASAAAASRNHNSALDGLRGLAALSVVVFHAWLYGFTVPPVDRSSFEGKLLFETRIGLVCFFVLSGFLLYRAFARAALTGSEPVPLGRYCLRRLARIVPAYYVSLLGSVVLLWGAGSVPGVSLPSAGRLPLFALFAQNYSLETAKKLNPVTWTLCVEATFYLALPLLGLIALRLGRRRAAHQALVLGSLVVLTVVWNALAHARGWNAIASISLPAYAGHFALGMLVALWVERRRLERPPAAARLGGRATAALTLAGVALVVANGCWHATSSGRAHNVALAVLADLPAALGFALVVAAAAGGGGSAVRWLRARPLAGAGVISYGIYLWHIPLLLAARRFGALPDALLPRLALVAALAAAVASVSWRYVERPILERVGRGRTRVQPAAQPREAPATT